MAQKMTKRIMKCMIMISPQFGPFSIIIDALLFSLFQCYIVNGIW